MSRPAFVLGDGPEPLPLADEDPAYAPPVARRAPMLVETLTKPPKPKKLFTPVSHPCACGAWGSFGLLPPAVLAPVWFCATHRPADYYGGAAR